MKQEYENLISELDKNLSMTRTLWLEALDDKQKAKWWSRIDQLLDERLRLMALRDSK